MQENIPVRLAALAQGDSDKRHLEALFQKVWRCRAVGKSQKYIFRFCRNIRIIRGWNLSGADNGVFQRKYREG